MPNAALAVADETLCMGPAGRPLSIDQITEGRKRRPIQERFWEKVRIAGTADCWEWQAAKNSKGYGRLTSGRGIHLKAHRVAFALAHGGEITDRSLVLHRCDNPSCCNPAHLFLGTPKENTQDMLAKGRGANGSGGYFGRRA